MSEIGALSLRIQETGGQAVVDRLKDIDARGGDAGAALKDVTVAMKGVTASSSGIASAASQVAKWAGTQEELSKEVAEGTRLFALQARTVDATSKAAVQELRSAAAAQRDWLKQVGASTEQQLKFGAAVQTFERKVAAAESAQARQTAATARQSQATQALNGNFIKANGEVTAFGKAGLRAVNGLAFAFSQMADQGEASLRSIAGQMTSVLALMGKGGAVASIASTLALSVFDVLRGGQKRAIDKMALESQTASRAELTRTKAAIDLTEAAQQTGYQQGLSTLRDHYAQRAQIIAARTAAEIAARQQQAAAAEREAEQRLDFVRIAGKDLPDALRGDTLKQADQLRAQATQLRAEIDALTKQGQAETLRNAAERAAAEKQLAEQALGFETRRLTAQGQGHRARLALIAMEVDAYEKLLVQQGIGEADRALALDQYRTAITRQVQLEREMEQVGIAQQQLDAARARIQGDLVAGRIDELQAAQQIAQAERDALPPLQVMVGKALELAAALGDQGAIAAVQRLKQELDGLGRDTALDPIVRSASRATAGAAIKAARAELERRVAENPDIVLEPQFAVDMQNLGQVADSVDAEFQNLGANVAGVLGAAIAAGFSGGDVGQVVLQGLGSLFVQMGQALMAYGVEMIALLPAFSMPLLSGPAALAAGAALVALGGTLGGIASGKKGGGGGGGARFAGLSAGTGSPLRLTIADAQIRRATAPGSVGRAMSGSASMAPAGPTWGRPIVASSPEGQRILGESVAQFTRRGGKV